MHNFIERSKLILAYIYKITNLINQKAYIGKTEYRNPNKRWQEHCCESKKERSQHRAIYRALKKYGIENFQFEILEETQEPNEREVYYIQFYNTFHNGYNETLGGEGRPYLDLDEQQVCKYYLECKSLAQTGKYFQCDPQSIDRILYKNNIQKFEITEVLKHTSTSKKAVAQIDKNTNEIIKIFESASEAERECNCNKHIQKVCLGKRKTAGGFKWAYVEDLQKET